MANVRSRRAPAVPGELRLKFWSYRKVEGSAAENAHGIKCDIFELCCENPLRAKLDRTRSAIETAGNVVGVVAEKILVFNWSSSRFIASGGKLVSNAGDHYVVRSKENWLGCNRWALVQVVGLQGCNDDSCKCRCCDA